jgi:hypothetical protein
MGGGAQSKLEHDFEQLRLEIPEPLLGLENVSAR